MRAWVVGACGAAALAASSHVKAADGQGPSLMDALAAIQSHRFVDLTHTFAPGIPHWKGAPDERVKTLYTVEKDGFRINEYCHIGQWGTHVDPPAHFHAGLRTVDQIDPKEMLMPLVVIDVHDKAAGNADYVLSLDDVHSWEQRHGRIPRGAFVAMRTDWSKRWPDDKALANKDAAGVFHYPGWSLPVLKLLYEERGITRLGARDHGHRSRYCDHQGRLLARVLHPRDQSLPDRTARESRPGARGGGRWSGSPSRKWGMAQAFPRV